jgi:hypothetical protein
MKTTSRSEANMITNWLIVDVASAPIPDAALYLEGSVKAPSNYKDEDKIAAYIAEKEAERLAMAATDIDLAQITGLGLYRPDGEVVSVLGTGGDELVLLRDLAGALRSRPTIVTYGGFNFDLPLVMRRARYLGVEFPALNLDRYKSPHLDLCDLLSDRNPQRRRPLGFYAKRLGWTDIEKPLSGADEAKVQQTGQWDALADSLRHDITATYRLACWLGLIQPHLVEASAEAIGAAF